VWKKKKFEKGESLIPKKLRRSPPKQKKKKRKKGVTEKREKAPRKDRNQTHQKKKKKLEGKIWFNGGELPRNSVGGEVKGEAKGVGGGFCGSWEEREKNLVEKKKDRVTAERGKSGNDLPTDRR